MRPNVRFGAVAIPAGSVIILCLYLSTIPAKEKKLSSIMSNWLISAASPLDSSESAHQAKSPSHPTSTFPPPPILKKFIPVTQKDVDGVQKFVLFVGYGRSGHSIIGSMMDAHPDMIIANQYLLFEKWRTQAAKLMNKAYLFNALYNKSFADVTKGLRRAEANRKGYTLHMNNSWQGQFNHLKVIGDKSGEMTSRLYKQSPVKLQKYYRELVDTVRMPVHTIHVIRNPYDIVATKALYIASSTRHKLPASETNKFDNPEVLMAAAKGLFKVAESTKDFIVSCNLSVLEVYSEDLIEDPKSTMKKICNFLDLECWDEYLQQCYDKTYKSPSKTRNVVKWTSEILDYINGKLMRYPNFHRYKHSVV